MNKRFDKEGHIDRIVKALRKVEEEALNEAPARGGIKKKADKPKEGITLKNILGIKRRKIFKEAESKDDQAKATKRKIDVGDRVKIQTKKFGPRGHTGM